jgi:hypothetical protein
VKQPAFARLARELDPCRGDALDSPRIEQKRYSDQLYASTLNPYWRNFSILQISFFSAYRRLVIARYDFFLASDFRF